MPRAISAASIAARTSAAVRPARVAPMPARCAAAVASAARRSSATAASSCSSRSAIIASASGASSTSSTPGRISRFKSRLCSRQRLDVGRGQRGDGAPADARGQAGERAHRTAGRLGDLLERARRALPQRLLGLRLRQIEGERRAVVDGDRAAQLVREQVEEVAAGPVGVEVRGVVARAGKAGGHQRRPVAEQLGEPRASRLAGAALQIRIAGRHRSSVYRQRRRPGPGAGGRAVAPSSGQACLG